MHLQDSSARNGVYSPRDVERRRVQLQPRTFQDSSTLKKHTESVDSVRRGYVRDFKHADSDDISQLGIIRNPEDQKQRDEGMYDLIRMKIKHN